MDYEKLYHEYRIAYADSLDYIDGLFKRICVLEKELQGKKDLPGRKVRIPFTLDEYMDLKEKKHTPEEISKSLGISLRTMYRYLKLLQKKNSISEEADPVIPAKPISYIDYCNYKSMGLPDYMIAEKLGVGADKLNRFLCRVQHRAPKDFDYNHYQELKSLGLPDYKIANELNISPAKLSGCLKRISNDEGAIKSNGK